MTICSRLWKTGVPRMRKIQLIAVIGIMVCMLTACGNEAKKYSKNTLVIKRNDSLVEVAVENFKDSSVKAEDLTSYITEQIEDYNTEQGKKVIRQKSLDTEDMSKVKLVLTYKDIESYNGFNQLDCVLDDFSKLKESQLTGSFKTADGKKTVKVSDVEGVDKATVLIIGEATDVVCSGNILYYNDKVTIKDGIATTSGKGDAIIIFK